MTLATSYHDNPRGSNPFAVAMGCDTETHRFHFDTPNDALDLTGREKGPSTRMGAGLPWPNSEEAIADGYGEQWEDGPHNKVTMQHARAIMKDVCKVIIMIYLMIMITKSILEYLMKMRMV